MDQHFLYYFMQLPIFDITRSKGTALFQRQKRNSTQLEMSAFSIEYFKSCSVQLRFSERKTHHEMPVELEQLDEPGDLQEEEE